MARGDNLIFLDDDIIVSTNWIDNYNKHFNKDPDKVYFGKLLYVETDNLPYLSLDDVKNKRFDKIEQFLLSNSDPRKSELKNIKLHEKVWGGNLGMNSKIFNLLNGYDEDFISWGGLDEDLGWRLRREGYDIVLVDDCEGYHLGSSFIPLEEVFQKKGVRLFNEVKKFDKTNKRNRGYKNRESFSISIVYDGSKFKIELYKKGK